MISNKQEKQGFPIINNSACSITCSHTPKNICRDCNIEFCSIHGDLAQELCHKCTLKYKLKQIIANAMELASHSTDSPFAKKRDAISIPEFIEKLPTSVPYPESSSDMSPTQAKIWREMHYEIGRMYLKFPGLCSGLSVRDFLGLALEFLLPFVNILTWMHENIATFNNED